ncbi:GntR family transcriptional regulator [Hydrogenophaga crassostreae]|uniref:GntR family transcriptional regulator n=1 Tax=Hydrogenophaga crassostreae TaxID=1763535 RepID=A0A162W3D0_9BURK|nr:GntR family transcriptional regulator [Hydrogenophaga crassostreae]AOW14440.1 GntR family transcriptional regulator [Hydrogenophaga crassostreae]OAD43537.1 GntR family transcriptional regulator [Hydrogenophaga crassostreae]
MISELDPIENDASALSVVAVLRKMIIAGDYAAGERLAEIPVSERLGVSRTPVRLAFRTLEQEGLLEKTGKRGLVVRAISQADVQCAIEVRGALEGLAARRLAERGLSADQRETLRDCVTQGAKLLAKGHLLEDDIGAWSALNQTFHRTVVEGTDSRVIADAIARNDHLPFASASSISIDRDALPHEYEKLRLAQSHHALVLDALERRESARVEMLMREHAYVGFRYASLIAENARHTHSEAEC